MSSFFFFNDTATTEIYTLSLHDALPIYLQALAGIEAKIPFHLPERDYPSSEVAAALKAVVKVDGRLHLYTDRKSTRLNSSHLVISYAVFCLKKKKPVPINLV